MRDFAQGILAQLQVALSFSIDSQRSFCQQQGVRIAEKKIVAGQNIHDVLDSPALDGHIQQVLDGNHPPSGILYQTQNKQVLAVFAASAQTESEGTLLVLEDVTEYFKAKKEAALISKLADETPDAIVIMSPDWEVFYKNRAAKAYFGDIQRTCLLTEFQDKNEAAKLKTNVYRCCKKEAHGLARAFF